MMKVCITRNAEARTNAAIARIAHALEHAADDVCLLTRNRYVNHYGKIKRLKYKISDKEIFNYEVRLKSTSRNGIFNILQLILFQLILFIWLMKNKDKYDIIHAFDLDTGLPAFLVTVFARKKYVYHIADFYVDSREHLPKSLKSIIRKLEHDVINKAEATIICTEDREKQIEGSHPKKLVVVHNTPMISKEVIDSVLRPETDVPEPRQEIVFTYVGELNERRFIKAAIDIIKKHSNVILNIAGMGKLAEYVEQAAKEYENIRYFGIIDYGKALELYSKTDYMFAIYDPAVPNHKFSAPNKVYEAMLLGKPIIVAQGTGIDRIVLNNAMGLVINYSEDNFEKTIKNILDNPFMGLQMAKNSKKAYASYSWHEMKSRIKNIYSHI